MPAIRKTRAAPILRLLRDKRGDAYVDLLIKLAVIMSLILCFMAVAPLFTVKLKVDYMARSLTRTIELSGQRGSEYGLELSRLESETMLSPGVNISGPFSGDGKLQLRDAFSITVTIPYSVKLATPIFGPPITLTVPISSTVSGRGEVYWKDWTG